MTRTRPVPAIAWLALLALLGFAAATVFNPARPALALSNCAVSSSDAAIDTYEQDLIDQINAFRVQNGGAALKRSTNLERAAAWMAYDLGTRSDRVFSHTDSVGRDPGTRATQCGYAYSNSTGENIGAGTVRDTAQEQFDGWFNSPGHKANMLDTSYRTLGIGRAYVPGSTYGYYWVADFGTRDDNTDPGGAGGGGSTPTPTPSPSPTPSPPPGGGGTTLTRAAMQSPAPGSTLTSSAVTFSWSAGTAATGYKLRIGSTPGGAEYLSTTTSSTSRAVTGLPANGSTVYVKLVTFFNGSQQSNSYTYAASSGSGSGGATATASPTASPSPSPSPAPGSGANTTLAQLTSPGSGAVIHESTTFRWSAGTSASGYRIDIGTSVGGKQLGSGSFQSFRRSASAGGLPTDGSSLYVRLWTLVGGTWRYNDYSFVTGP